MGSSIVNNGFLQAVIGDTGLEALKKASALSNVSEDLVFARVLLSWLQLRSRYGFNSTLPGTEHHLRLKKSSSGYTGVLTLANQTVPFANDPLERVAAWISISLGITEALGKKNFSTLPRLGKSVDILVKTHYVSMNLKKAPNKMPMEGQVAKPIKPIEPEKPIAVQSKEQTAEMAQLNKQETEIKEEKALIPFKLKTLDFKAKCKDCGELLFKNMQWIGCICLSSDASVKARGKDLVLEPKGTLSEWIPILNSLRN